MLPRDVAKIIARKVHCMARDAVLNGKIVLEWNLLSGYSVESGRLGYCAIIANSYSCNMSLLEGKKATAEPTESLFDRKETHSFQNFSHEIYFDQ